MKQKEAFIKEMILSVILLGVVGVITFFVIRGIKLREDLAFLQIDFTDTLIEAKKCLDGGGIVQDVSKSKDPEKIFVCSQEKLSTATFPDLKKLSRRGIEYKYLSPQKCLGKKCSKNSPRINIGRGFKLVLSCEVKDGFCKMK